MASFAISMKLNLALIHLKNLQGALAAADQLPMMAAKRVIRIVDLTRRSRVKPRYA
jgi:hypothetical protein